MPFKSEKQRRYLHANEPDIAKRWERKKTQKHLPAAKRRAAKRKSKGRSGDDAA